MTSLSRRALLTGLAATGATVMFDTPTAAAPRAPFFERIGKPIGLQLYTLGDDAGKDLDATFAAVAAIGFRDLELPGLYGRAAAEVKASAARSGLTISSLHLAASTRGPAPGLSLADPASKIADTMGDLGAGRVVLPILQFPDGMRPQPGESPIAMIARSIAAAGEDPWKRTAALLNEKGAALQPAGLRIAYHNHNLEFAPVGKTTGWDILMREFDPRLVDLEVDVGWVATAGRDTVAFLSDLRGRVKQLHMKDVAKGHVIDFALSTQPAEVGAGTIDWPRLLRAAERAGVERYYVEQEPPFTGPRIDAVAHAYRFLSRVRA